MNSKIIILTGEIQTGKTSLLQQFCKQRKDTAGILTPIFNNKRVFYDIADNRFFNMEATGNEEKIAIGKYLFSTASFEKANDLLLTESKRTDIRFLILDEIGPLEIRHNKGLYECLKKIVSVAFPFTLILVVRQPLVNEMVSLFKLNTPAVLNLQQMKSYFEGL